MKKILSIASAFVFLLGAAGYYIGFTAADHEAKDQMRASIETTAEQKDAIWLSFTPEQLAKEVRFVDSREFIYNDKHYDVVERQNQEGKVVFKCVSDNLETSLFGWFKKNLDHQSPKSDGGKISFNLLTLDWFFQTETAQVSIFSIENFTLQSQLIPHSFSVDIPTPPPNC